MPPAALALLAATVSRGGQLILVEVPVVTTLLAAAIGWIIRRAITRQDTRLGRIETKLEDVAVSQAVLVSGDLDDDRELQKMRDRLHTLENAVTFIKARLAIRDDAEARPRRRDERGDDGGGV